MVFMKHFICATPTISRSLSMVGLYCLFMFFFLPKSIFFKIDSKLKLSHNNISADDITKKWKCKFWSTCISSFTLYLLKFRSIVLLNSIKTFICHNRWQNFKPFTEKELSCIKSSILYLTLHMLKLFPHVHARTPMWTKTYVLDIWRVLASLWLERMSKKSIDAKFRNNYKQM